PRSDSATLSSKMRESPPSISRTSTSSGYSTKARATNSTSSFIAQPADHETGVATLLGFRGCLGSRRFGLAWRGSRLGRLDLRRRWRSGRKRRALDELRNRRRRHGPHLYPMIDTRAIEPDLDRLARGIINPQLFDEATVPRAA